MKKRSMIACILILFLGGFFRFYRLHDWLIYGMDQEYQALISSAIVSGRNLPLIGVNASDTGLYLGPWFSYAAAAIHWLSGGNPLGGAIAASLTGLAVIVLIYILGKRLAGERAALLAALIYASSLLIAFYERQFWNPTPVPLISLLIGFFLLRLAGGRITILPWLFFLLGLSFSIHLSLLIFFPLAGYILWQKRKSIPRRLMYHSLSLFFVTVAPQLLFELSHRFLQTRALANLLSGQQNAAAAVPAGQRLALAWDTLGRFVWLPGSVDWFTLAGQCRELSHLYTSFPVGSILMSIALIAAVLREKTPLVMRYLFVATLVFVLLYPRQITEYYFLFLFPWLALSAGMQLDWLGRQGRWVTAVILVLLTVFVSLNIRSLAGSSYSYSYRDKMDTIAFSKPLIGDAAYALEAAGECPRFGGWRYLFEQRVGQAPVSSYMDSYFAWLYPTSPTLEHARRTVFLSMIDGRMSGDTVGQWKERERQFLGALTTIAESQFGRIRVYVLEN